MKIVLTANTDGYITQASTRIRDGDTSVEVADAVVSRIIPGISKITDGALLYRCAVETDADGYVTGAGTDPAGDTDLYADELTTLVPGATKLTDGHLVLDADKAAEIEAELNKVTPTAEQQMIASLTLELAQLKAGGAS
jgi:hypothetical protein